MSYSTGTTHYNLPLTQGSDKRDWSDTNQAFEDLDAAVYQASSDATGALSAAQSAQTTANSAATDAASAVSTANAASSAAATASETASLARTEAQSAQSSASSAVTTAQSAAAQASNADTVALAAQSNIGTMSNLNTQDKTSLVAAINEVLSQIGGGMPELDFANKVALSTTAITTSKAGAIIGAFKSTGNAGDLTVDTASVLRIPASADLTANACIHFISSGSSIALSVAIASSLHAWFVPYK